MRVVFCRRGLCGAASGDDQQLLAYATGMKGDGYDARVLLVFPGEDKDPSRDTFYQAGVPVTHLHGHPAHTAARLARKLAMRLTFQRTAPDWEELKACQWALLYHLKRRPDVLHVIDPWENVDLLRSAHAAGIPILYQDVRGPRDPSGVVAQNEPDWAAWYEKLAEVLPLCSAVAVLSPRLAPVFRERLGYNGPMGVLPVLVEEPAAAPLVPRPAGGPVLGFAGQMEFHNGCVDLLDAAARLARDFPEMRVHLAGAGSDELEAVGRAHGFGISRRCTFAGLLATRPERSAFLRGLDVFALPAIAETNPYPVIEAMAHGLPVVATTVGALPDVVSAEAGILVPPGDVPALADALGRLAADPDLRARMGQAGRERYHQLFSPSVVLPVLQETYRRVAARGGSTPAAAPPLPHPWARVAG